MQPNPDFYILGAEDTSGIYPFLSQQQLQQQHIQLEFHTTTSTPSATTTTTTTTSTSPSSALQYAAPEDFVMHENDAMISENLRCHQQQQQQQQPHLRLQQPQQNHPPETAFQQQQPQSQHHPAAPPIVSPQQRQTLSQQQQPQQQQQQPHQNNICSGVDFRRRRNWSERILNEIAGLLHVLSPVGKILHCSPSSVELTGYAPEELIGRSLTEFLHVDDIDIFIRDFHRAFHTRSQIKIMYRFRKKDQSYTLFETIGHPRTDVPGQPPGSFFAIAQPYPTAMDSLFDSFLELKMENEWLKQRLREIPVDVPVEPVFNLDHINSNTGSDVIVGAEKQQQDKLFSNDGGYTGKRGVTEESTTTTTTSSSTTSSVAAGNNNSLWLRDDAVMNVYSSNNSNASSGNNSNRVRSPAPPPQQQQQQPSNPAAAAAAAAATAVGMVSTGVVDMTETTAATTKTTGELMKDKSKRRKKQRGADEYVCTDCGTATSPEWRKGPHGPKTLCNACGLRWAKKSKRKGLSTD